MWHKNAQKNSEQISCHYTKFLHGKNWPSWWRFLRSFFLTASKLSRRLITAAKRKEKEKRKGKKIFKIEKPKDIGHFLIQKLKILISAHAWAKLLQNMMLVERKSSCHVANIFSTRLNLQKIVIWLCIHYSCTCIVGQQ